jgi:hypothetical protein
MINLVFYTALSGFNHFKYDGMLFTTWDYVEAINSILSYYPTPFYTVDRLLADNPDIDRICVVSKNQPPYIYKGQGRIEYVCNH